MILDDDASPIIILGAARSGTKFLRSVLASGKGVAAVPYDVNYVWRYGAETAPDDRLDPANLTARQSDFIRRTLPSLAGMKRQDVLIEKTVSNSLRVPYLAAVFPNARFVHLLRDGRDVTESAMRLWRAPPDWNGLFEKLHSMPLANLGYVGWFGWNFFKGLVAGRKGGKVWGPRYPGIDEDEQTLSLAETCALQWRHCVETAVADLRNIPQERVFQLRYEDLVANDTAIRNLVRLLDLPDPDATLAAWTAQLEAPGVAKWRKMPDPDRAAMLAVTTPLLTELGYIDCG